MSVVPIPLVLIPLDARPVCYDLPRRLAAMAGLDLSLPPADILGAMKEAADADALSTWIQANCFGKPVIVAMDMLAYGGLIPSRLGHESFEELKTRTQDFLAKFNSPSISAFSSILRIPSYNNDEEEPEYWAEYGAQLYEYSFALHQNPQEASTDLPPAIVDDFMSRRARNFKFNQWLLTLLQNKTFDYLTFCQDDTGAYGLNVKEAEQLATAIESAKLMAQAHIQTGADEVACIQMARWFLKQTGQQLKIFPFYSNPDGYQIIAKFDGLPIGHVVEKAIRASGASVAHDVNQADLVFVVHTPGEKQGDHADQLPAGNLKPEQLQRVLEILRQSKPTMLADVAYANGSDPVLTEALLTSNLDLKTLYGYAGWNTPGNTIGTSVAMGVMRLLAERQKTFDADAFYQLLLIRFADDALYQPDVRKRLRASEQPLDQSLLTEWMSQGAATFQQRLGLSSRALKFDFPCNRTFEVAVSVS